MGSNIHNVCHTIKITNNAKKQENVPQVQEKTNKQTSY